MKYVKRGYAEYKKPSFWCLHHFFTGLLFGAAGGFYLLFHQLFGWSLAALIFGFWLALDDYYQHYIQLKQWERFCYYDKYTLWNWLPNTILFGETYT